MRTEIYEVMFVILGIAILFFSLAIIPEYFPWLRIMSPILNILGAMTAIIPPFLFFYTKYVEGREIENQFIIFISDLTEAIDSGMTLPVALKYTSKRDYGILTKHIREISGKVSWGVPFEEALKIFSKKVGNTMINRSISTIIQTYKVGGKLSDTLRAISQSLIEINKIRKERSASVQAQIVTSYLIFFVFIFILVILQTVLVPAFSAKVPEIGESHAKGVGLDVEIYNTVFINFIIVQGFFAGLVTGKISEGTLISGLKHSVILILLGYAIFSFATQFQVFFA